MAATSCAPALIRTSVTVSSGIGSWGAAFSRAGRIRSTTGLALVASSGAFFSAFTAPTTNMEESSGRASRRVAVMG